MPRLRGRLNQAIPDTAAPWIADWLYDAPLVVELAEDLRCAGGLNVKEFGCIFTSDHVIHVEEGPDKI